MKQSDTQHESDASREVFARKLVDAMIKDPKVAQSVSEATRQLTDWQGRMKTILNMQV